MKKVWIVGEVIEGDFPRTVWSLLGVFDKERFAEAACQNEGCFTTQVEVNAVSPAGMVEEFENVRWPKSERCVKCGGRGMVPKYHICPLCEGEIVSCEWKTKANVIAGGWWVYSCGNCDEIFAEEDNSILIPCPDCPEVDGEL